MAENGSAGIQVPEWEHKAISHRNATPAEASRSTKQTALRYRFDAVLPPYKRHLGMKRRTFLIVLSVIVLALLALVIGLSVGLTKDNSTYAPSSFHKVRIDH